MVEKIRNGRNEWASYDRDRHRYWIGTDIDEETSILGEMTPVTKLISQFYRSSPWQGHGTPQDIEFGNRVHSVAAACLRSQKPDLTPSSEDERRAFGAVWKFAARIRDNNRVLGVEQAVFSHGAETAGTIDLAFDCNGRLFLCDWKTGDLTLPAKCKFDAPFSHLAADPMTIYSLQCSMYQVLIEAGGFYGFPNFAPAKLLWLHKEAGEWKIDAISCRDLRREAAMMVMSRIYTPWYEDWKKRCPF